jgi:hypothetical protein
MPQSPEGPPPPSFAPQSPEGPPPDAAPESEPEDPYVAFLLRVRLRAVERAGGKRKWNELSDERRESLLDSCTASLQAEGDSPF